MSRYESKTLMLTPSQIEAIEEVISRMRTNKIEMSYSSIVRILIDDYLDTMEKKFSFGGDA